MRKRFNNSLAQASENRALFVLLVLITLNIIREIITLFRTKINWLYSSELYIFPPAAFFADYLWMKQIFPKHPITELAILSTAFMAMTLTLFILRPPKKVRAHWVRS